MKKIYIGSDHAGFKLKEVLKEWMEHRKIPFEDVGDLVLNPVDDYPEYAEKVAKKVMRNKSKGILICGSGQGVCIAANKIKGVRAVVPYLLKEVRLSRTDDDANVLCLSGWYIHTHKAMQMVEKFIHTPFSGAARHVRRLKKIQLLERS